jgi:hypothetical protein
MFSLRFERGLALYTDIFSRRAFPWLPNDNLMKVTAISFPYQLQGA